MENDYELYDCLGCNKINKVIYTRKTGQSSENNFTLSESYTADKYSENIKNNSKNTNHKMSTNIHFNKT